MDIVIVAQYLRNIEDFEGNNSRFVYLAKMLINRDNSVYEIGKVLDQINIENETDYSLNVYTRLTDSIRDRFKSIESIKLYGFVSGKEFEEVFWNADMFLHIEDFHEDITSKLRI